MLRRRMLYPLSYGTDSLEDAPRPIRPRVLDQPSVLRCGSGARDVMDMLVWIDEMTGLNLATDALSKSRY